MKPESALIWAIVILEVAVCVLLIWLHGYYAGLGRLRGWEKNKKEKTDDSSKNRICD